MLKLLKKCGRGTVLFVDRFARLGNAHRLHKAMELLTLLISILSCTQICT